MKRRSLAGTGVVLVLTVLLCLVLVLFSMLSLMSARSDWALSQRLATLEEQYYEADRQATLLLREFEAEGWEEYEELIPMGEVHGLRIHFVREPDGTTRIAAWNTMLLDSEALGGEDALPIWGGDDMNWDF